MVLGPLLLQSVCAAFANENVERRPRRSGKKHMQFSFGAVEMHADDSRRNSIQAHAWQYEQLIE